MLLALFKHLPFNAAYGVSALIIVGLAAAHAGHGWRARAII
jgi:inner membrane protein involved in colicin E2 resistance